MNENRAGAKIGTILDRARDQLDLLIGDVEGGIRSSLHFDDCEERAREIAAQLRDAFRRGVL